MPSTARLSLERAVGYIGLFCSVLIVATIIGLAFNARHQLYRDATDEARTSAFFLADHASRLFEASDFVINEAIAAVENMSWPEIAESRPVFDRLQALSDRLPYVEAIWLNDDTGQLRLSTVQFPTPPSNAADRDFFRAHVGPTNDLYVSSILVGRVTGKPSFLLSRRVTHPGGALAGVASVTAELDYFTSFYGSLKLPYAPIITLFRFQDMGVLASHPPSTGQQMRHAAALARAIEENPFTGLVFDDGGATLSYHKVAELPVYVGVTIPAASLHRLWRGQLAVYGLLGGVALLALAALTLFAFRQARRVALAQGELENRVNARTADLADANTELATLFQEVHHRVKNNLQVVTSLLRLQQMRVESPHARAALQDSIDRIHAMGLVHQLLYSKQELSQVDFAEYAAALTRQLVEAYGMEDQVDVAVGGEPVRFDLDTAIPVALIVNEVVSNALKHGFPDGRKGRIAIDLHRQGADNILAVRDDGVGLPPDLDWTRTQSLGLRIVRSLSTQLGGTPEFAADAGTAFTLRFPAKGDA